VSEPTDVRCALAYRATVNDYDPMRTPRPIALSDDARAQAIASLKQYADENLDDAIGDLKAGLLLDFLLEEIGPSIYNQAIADARAYFEERTADLAAVSYRVEFPLTTNKRPPP